MSDRLPIGLCGAPPGVPILPPLAAAFAAIARADPMAPTRMRLFVPTRRAGRAFEAALADAAAGGAVLSPRIAPIGDLAGEAEDADAWDVPADAEADGALSTPAAAPPLVRRVTLAKLAIKMAEAEGETLDPGAAMPLAAALESLLDEAQIAGVELCDFEALDVEDSADHWRRALVFLKILFAEWPAIRDALGFCDPAQRRDRALRALAERWTAAPPRERMIAAGTTGSHPAVAEALKALLAAPECCVILPGFDFGLRPEDWAAVAQQPTHPQHGLARLLSALDRRPEDVRPWPEASPRAAARADLLRSALAPVSEQASPPPPSPTRV
ncbi:MAG: hypothetical protein AAF684_11995, partial [Pseudomonadota bacterium]